VAAIRSSLLVVARVKLPILRNNAPRLPMGARGFESSVRIKHGMGKLHGTAFPRKNLPRRSTTPTATMTAPFDLPPGFRTCPVQLFPLDGKLAGRLEQAGAMVYNS
jgi:hypothetical protein